MGLGYSPLGKLKERWPEVLAGWEKCVVLAYTLYVGACALRQILVVSCNWLGVSWGAVLGAAPRRSNIGQTLLKNVRAYSLLKGGTGVFCRGFMFKAIFNVIDRGR